MRSQHLFTQQENFVCSCFIRIRPTFFISFIHNFYNFFFVVRFCSTKTRSKTSTDLLTPQLSAWCEISHSALNADFRSGKFNTHNFALHT